MADGVGEQGVQAAFSEVCGGLVVRVRCWLCYCAVTVGRTRRKCLLAKTGLILHRRNTATLTPMRLYTTLSGPVPGNVYLLLCGVCKACTLVDGWLNRRIDWPALRDVCRLCLGSTLAAVRVAVTARPACIARAERAVLQNREERAVV